MSDAQGGCDATTTNTASQVVNSLPNVNAGSNQTISLGQSIDLDATVTIDGVAASSFSTNTEPFTSSPSDYSASSNTSSQGMWNGSNSDDIGWDLNSGSTGSNGTGPNNGRGGSGDYYIYAECTGSGNPNKTFILESDVLSSSITSLSFYYHAYGGTMGVLNIDYSTNIDDNNF